jgi:hypothetical protein
VANPSLNPDSQQWARNMDKTNRASQQALARTTMELQNTDRALQSSITRLNVVLDQIRIRNEYLLSLIVKSSSTRTGDTVIPVNGWSTTAAIRPSVTVTSPSGRIAITISAYGHNAMMTYSIAGVVDRADSVSSYLNQSAQLVLPGGSATGSSQKEWVQNVPVNTPILVQAEAFGVGTSPIIASPSLIVQVLPH